MIAARRLYVPIVDELLKAGLSRAQVRGCIAAVLVIECRMPRTVALVAAIALV